MFIKYQQILLEIIVIILLFFAERLYKQLVRHPRAHWHCWWGWTIVLWIMIIHNLGVYWFAYPVALWMILALLLVLLQVVHNHEFLYRRYWPVFWRFSTYYAEIVFILSLGSGQLPLI